MLSIKEELAAASKSANIYFIHFTSIDAFASKGFVLIAREKRYGNFCSIFNNLHKEVHRTPADVYMMDIL